jgi:glycosyltransferase involved in cell wall biosynthesis
LELSVVVPTWSGTQALADMALSLLKYVRPMCDELLVTEDSEEFYYKELEEIADIYLMHPNLGDVVNINYGMKRTHGDYIAVLNSDLTIYSGNLRDLCIPGRVVCPDAKSGGHGGYTGGLVVIPRTVLDEYGYLDESRQHPHISHGMGADMEYSIRVKEIMYFSDKVKCHHITGVSYAEQRRLGEQAERERLLLHPNKEIDPTRHIARLDEDPTYRKEWEGVS